MQYADQKLLDMLGYDCPEQVDLAQYAVQMLVREKTGECLRFVSSILRLRLPILRKSWIRETDRHVLKMAPR